MNKKILLTLFMSVLLLSAVLGILFIKPVKAYPTEIIVPDQYKKIQWAIGNASSGDTIIVKAGRYFEHVVVNKSLTLIGEDRSTTIIDGSGQNKTIVKIMTASEVKILGFTIENGSRNFPQFGILMGKSENVTVYNNIIKDNYYGVLLAGSNNTNIVNNIIIHNYVFGIQFSDSGSNEIIGNTIANNPIGVYISSETSPSNIFYHNNFINNTHQEVCFAPTKWDNGKEGNYWSDYTGVDTNGDGIGDTETPHLGMDKYPLINPWVPVLGDINGDKIVDITDIVIAALAFGSYPGHPRWNPIADINNDGLIDITDLVIIGVNFGKRL